MFLNRLNTEQKELFIDLCIHASLSNDDFAKEEKDTIDAYCVEMNISETRYETTLSYDEVINRLVDISNSHELRIILFEISALIISDHKYDELEKKFMESLVDKIGVTNDYLNEMMEYLHNLKELYYKIDRLIFE